MRTETGKEVLQRNTTRGKLEQKNANQKKGERKRGDLTLERADVEWGEKVVIVNTEQTEHRENKTT